MIRFIPLYPILALGLLAVVGPGPIASAEGPAAGTGGLVPLLVDGVALVDTWSPPVAPAGLLKAGEKARVQVRFVVDENGAVTTARVLESEAAGLNDAAIAAIKTWTFRPALTDSKPVVISMDETLVFSNSSRPAKPGLLPPVVPRPSPRTEAEAKAQPAGDSPDGMTDRKLIGRVNFTCTIDAVGHVANPRILAASHVDFVPAALDALGKWEFTPAMQGDLPVKSELTGAVTFDSITEDPWAMLAANEITGPDGQLPTAAPKLVSVRDPAFPLSHLLAGEEGEAIATFVVSAEGKVGEIQIRSASFPEFGEALCAALEAWSFRPATKDGLPTEVALSIRSAFKGVPKEATGEEDELSRVVVAARKNAIPPAKGLDEKLMPIYRVAPTYPASIAATTKESGEALISMVICRDGRVRLVQALSASAPAFGWSAVNAISQWIFRPPLRGGKPVDVIVQLPVKFGPPAN